MGTRVYRRAVVLGGGGLTGLSWLIGVLAAFEAADIPVGDADLVLGTSAGSVVGAQLATGRPFAKQYRFLAAERVRARDMLTHLYRAIPTPTDEVIGQLARQSVASTSASTAETRVFRAADGVPATRAMAASTAVPQVFPPVLIQGRRYMPGGTRRATNANLAAEHDVVLCSGGTTVIEVSPDDASVDAFGDLDALDPDRIGPSARAGRVQGEVEAERVAAAWPARS